MRNFLLAGVGGQGIILAGDVIVAVGMAAGQDVKKAEVHGMAQRGGSVITHVRWGGHVYSPLFGGGEADYLIAFEKLEALRYVGALHPNSVALVNDYAIPPLTVASGSEEYPDDERIRGAITAVTPSCYLVPGIQWAEDLGSSRVHNVLLVGALSRFISDVPIELWLEAIRDRVPTRLADLNCQAFLKGRVVIGEPGFPTE